MSTFYLTYPLVMLHKQNWFFSRKESENQSKTVGFKGYKKVTKIKSCASSQIFVNRIHKCEKPACLLGKSDFQERVLMKELAVFWVGKGYRNSFLENYVILFYLVEK